MRIAAPRFAVCLVSSLLLGILTIALGARVSPASAAAMSTVESGMGGSSATAAGSPTAPSPWNDLLRERTGGGFALASSDTAYFAGGSFWVLEAMFESQHGVACATTGYVGDRSGSIETVEVVFNPGIVSYEQLLDFYWRRIDPTQEDGQPCESGPRYRAVLFYRDAGQRDAALAAREKLARRLAPGAPVATAIEAAGTFTRAADDDQDVYRKQRDRYRALLSYRDRTKSMAGIGQE
jgi:methionine-S-sulfoxide reductase